MSSTSGPSVPVTLLSLGGVAILAGVLLYVSIGGNVSPVPGPWPPNNQKAGDSSSPATPEADVTVCAREEVRNPVMVHVETHGFPLPPSPFELIVDSCGTTTKIPVAEQCLAVDRAMLRTDCRLSLKMPLGLQPAATVVSWNGQKDVYFSLPTVAPINVSIYSPDGVQVNGALYDGVVLEPQGSVGTCHTICATGAYVCIDLLSPEKYLVAYSHGLVPRSVRIKDIDGFPWGMTRHRFDLTAGLRIQGKVVDGVGMPMSNQTVLVRSYSKTSDGGWVSFGEARVRTNGGIWEEVITGDDGVFTFDGLGPTLAGISVHVTGPAKQLLPNPDNIIPLPPDGNGIIIVVR